ncbi:MAG TPA: carboxymuconolactone decarboxylase family protein [Gemmatimonadaceae bacterium]|nr:carboxymuconolactone decarboxylase family protein [Gemmatimonadaceae bacterium]
MTAAGPIPHILLDLDPPTRTLVRLSAIISAGTEPAIRDAFATLGDVPVVWVEELILQCHLFAGFPRALNAMREWRRWQPEPPALSDAGGLGDWRARGEATCAIVYGEMYERLRGNIRRLHPDLDDWMIVDGYGKVLSRPGLDLARRELCIVAACAVSSQDRQLHSHLHGALNAGAAPAAVSRALDAIEDLLDRDHAHSIHLLWSRVQGK